MKIGAIAQHISEDLGHSLAVLKELGLNYVEFCGSWSISAGRHDSVQTDEVVRLIKEHGLPVSCVSPRSFYMRFCCKIFWRSKIGERFSKMLQSEGPFEPKINFNGRRKLKIIDILKLANARSGNFIVHSENSATEPNNWGVDLNVTNLFDEDYVSGCQGVYVCSYGEGRKALLKAHLTW